MMKKIVSEQELDRQLAQLDQELSPTRDLWPGIEKALAKQHNNRQSNHHQFTMPKFAFAASIVAAVLLTWGGSFVNPINQQSSPTLAMEMAQSFEQTKQFIVASYGQNTTVTLTPELERQFEELAKARATLAKALENEPNNSDLLNLLRWTQQQELSLLQTVYSAKWQSI